MNSTTPFPKFTISLVKGTHLTATNKRAIAQLLERGWMVGHSRLIEYRILPVANDLYRVLITKAGRDEKNQPRSCATPVTVRVTPRQTSV